MQREDYLKWDIPKLIDTYKGACDYLIHFRNSAIQWLQDDTGWALLQKGVSEEQLAQIKQEVEEADKSYDGNS